MRVKILTAVVFKPAVIHSKLKHFGGHLGTLKDGGQIQNGPGGSWEKTIAKMYNILSIFSLGWRFSLAYLQD